MNNLDTRIIRTKPIIDSLIHRLNVPSFLHGSNPKSHSFTKRKGVSCPSRCKKYTPGDKKPTDKGTFF